MTKPATRVPCATSPEASFASIQPCMSYEFTSPSRAFSAAALSR